MFQEGQLNGRAWIMAKRYLSRQRAYAEHRMVAAIERMLAARADYDRSFSLRDQAVGLVSEGMTWRYASALGGYPDLIARRLGEQHRAICASSAWLVRKRALQSYLNFKAAALTI